MAQADFDETTTTTTEGDNGSGGAISQSPSPAISNTADAGGPALSTSANTFRTEASSGHQSSSSTISWGPATTASSLPNSEATGLSSSSSRPESDEPPSGFSEGAKKAVIAATTIGGTILLLLFLYTLWRRRKGARYSDIICCRRHSEGTIILEQVEDEDRFTALPIYREARYSIRSSRLGSTLSFGKMAKRPSGVPPNVVEHFHQQNPWIKDSWKTTNPSTPTREQHPLSQVTVPSPTVQKPEMTRIYNTSSNRIPSKPALAVEITSALPADANSPPREEDRWSWTNSQAPPTPRFPNPANHYHVARFSTVPSSSKHSSLSSLPKFKGVAAWVRNQKDRETTFKAPPPFKNKAAKPTLAPRKLSKKRAAASPTLPIQGADEERPADH